MFSNKVLYIPDYVVNEDVSTIIKYFDYYNIAKVKKVEIFKHIEPEYYVEDNNNYGFALIEIDKYYNNQGAINFYNNLENNKGIIVYDDPYFWEVKFSPFNDAKCSYVNDCVSNTCTLANYKKEENLKDPDLDTEEKYIYDDTSDDDDHDDNHDDDFNYNSYEKNFNKFKNKQSSKKRKLNKELFNIKNSIHDISTKQDKLLKLLIINNNLKNRANNRNNRNNLNNLNNKEFKNLWSRRLRVQIN